MRVVVIAVLLASAVVCTGCLNERVYMDPTQSMADWDGGGAFAFLRGDVGELTGIDNNTQNMWVAEEERAVEFSGDVPHQARPESSVFIDVRILNPDRLPVGVELRQQGVGDAWSTTNTTDPVLDVYICPNGEGISGNADDIVVTKQRDGSFTFVATSTDVAQNLDIDLDLGKTSINDDVDAAAE